MFKAVLFDLDNTLMNFIRMKETSINSAIGVLLDSELPVDFETAKNEIYDIYKKGHMEDPEVFQKFLSKYNQENNTKLIAKAVYAYRKAKAGAVYTYPKVRSTLLALIKSGCKLGIVSDAPKTQAWLRLVELGLDDFFDVVVTFDDTNKRKPSDLPFKKALEKINFSPGEILFVGDNPDRDLVGAKAIGFKTAFAAYGYYNTMFAIRPKENEINALIDKHKPDYVLNSFDDILKINKF